MSAERFFRALEARFAAQSPGLDALDAAVGDGDHGTTMLRGLRAAVAAPDGRRARAFMRASGGASGTLFGLILLEIEAHLETGSALGEGLARACARIRELGEVAPGDKSMVDALDPAAAALRGGGLAEAIAAARAGRDATRTLAARRGRAQYVENGGRGHLDPGAVSVVLILETLGEVSGEGAGNAAGNAAGEAAGAAVSRDVAGEEAGGTAAGVVVKKLFNSPETMVDDMLDGFVSAFARVERAPGAPRVIRRATDVKNPDEKVTLLIGNGSGHEPIAMGFVGRGLLDANVVGDVFAAPSADLILDGIADTTGAAGSILLISQHSGDMINGRAAVMLAQDMGLKSVALPMYDDISAAPPERRQDRRGGPGTMFIYKILGAAAEEGRPLEELVALGEAVRDRLVTLAAAVTPPVSPLTGQKMFELPEDEIFLGMGVHGEPGVGRVKVGPVRDLVALMVDRLLADRPLARGARACVIVNGMGGTTLMELLTVWEETRKALAARGIEAVAPMVGSYVTTQEMGGFSISLLEPTAQMLALWCAPSDTPFFPAIRPQGPEAP